MDGSTLPLNFPELSLNSPPPSVSGSTGPSLFESLPQELLEQIAFQLAQTTPYGPPYSLIPFLLSSRRIYEVLGPSNDNFYAELFKQRFDYKAAERRWHILRSIEERRLKKDLLNGNVACEVHPDDGLKLASCAFTTPCVPSEPDFIASTWSPLTSRDYASEFKRRCSVLSKMRVASITKTLPLNNSHPSSPRLQPLSPNSSGHKYTLSEPNELTQILWTCYLMLIENDGKNLEHLMRYADLRTYTRLFYRHSLLSDAMKPGWPKQSPGRGLGLWIGWLGGDDLASEAPKESDERFFVLKPYVFGAHKFDAFYAPWTIPRLPVTQKEYPLHTAPSDPFSADLRPLTQAQTIVHMGRRVELSPPILAHAAIFSFFYRMEQDPEVAAELRQTTATVPPQFHMTSTTPAPVVKPAKTARPKLESRLHDRDFVRLASCVDPYSSRGLPTLYCRGDFTGSWEGRFSFFDFDSYRDMLGGRMRSLYEGPFGDQPQVWKLEEKIVRVSRGRQGGTGPILNAGYEVGQQGPRMSQSPPASTSTSTSNGLSAGLASSSTSTFSASNPTVGTRRKSVDDPGDWNPVGRAGKRPRSIQGDSLQEEWENEEDDDDDYEILLTGSGHSAWGQFVLKGRVRAYDGMFVITKEYLTCSDTITRETRGRWLYRGYCVGGHLVGRWRDTHTPPDMAAYEGTFNCHRRAL